MLNEIQMQENGLTIGTRVCSFEKYVVCMIEFHWRHLKCFIA